MFAKAGVVVTATVAALLAVSPLAFAGGGDYDNDNDRDHHSNWDDNDDDDDDDDRDGDSTNCEQDISSERDGRGGGGLVNVSDLNVQVPVQLCDVDILSGVLGVLSKDLRNN
ncbi:MAG: hypothetical protein ACT4O0_15145 [Pseudonocardia sp.]